MVTTIQNLPTDVLSYCMAFLCPASIAVCSLVCKSWLAASRQEHVWKSSCATHLPNVCKSKHYCWRWLGLHSKFINAVVMHTFSGLQNDSEQNPEDRYEMRVRISSWFQASHSGVKETFLGRLACAEDRQFRELLSRERLRSPDGKIGDVTDSFIIEWIKQKGFSSKESVRGRKRRYIANQPVFFARFKTFDDSDADENEDPEYDNYERTNHIVTANLEEDGQADGLEGAVRYEEEFL